MRLKACLAVLTVLAVPPALAQVRVPQTVAVGSSPLSAVPSNKNGCTPINPCAFATPELGSATVPTPQAPPQPNLPAASENPPATTAPATAQADCPAPGARGGFARGGRGFGQGRGAFAGRGEGRGEGRGAFAGRSGRGGGRGIPANCLPPGRGVNLP